MIIDFYKSEGWKDILVTKEIKGKKIEVPLGHTFKNNSEYLLQITGNRVRLFKPYDKDESCYLFNKHIFRVKQIK